MYFTFTDEKGNNNERLRWYKLTKVNKKQLFDIVLVSVFPKRREELNSFITSFADKNRFLCVNIYSVTPSYL